MWRDEEVGRLASVPQLGALPSSAALGQRPAGEHLIIQIMWLPKRKASVSSKRGKWGRQASPGIWVLKEEISEQSSHTNQHSEIHCPRKTLEASDRNSGGSGSRPEPWANPPLRFLS